MNKGVFYRVAITGIEVDLEVYLICNRVGACTRARILLQGGGPLFCQEGEVMLARRRFRWVARKDRLQNKLSINYASNSC